MDVASNVASIFQAAFSLGFCAGIVVAAVVWWQASKRWDW